MGGFHLSQTPLSRSRIRSLIGEVLIAGFTAVDVDEHAETLLRQLQIRNIILFTRNMKSLQQIRQLTHRLRAIAKEQGYEHQLLICVDQENGIVRRLPPELPAFPGNMAVGATADAALAHAIGHLTARQLAACGINLNLAPVLDVNTNPANPVIGVRSYGEDPLQVATLGTAMLTGLQSAGVAACAKHFPGHGDTHEDSHLALPTVTQDMASLQRGALVPFKHAIAAGVKAIMTAHISFPATEQQSVPATMSAAILNGLLRVELGYEGVIITDCLEMNAISERFGVGYGAAHSFAAGADMVMVSHRLDRQCEAADALEQGVLSGLISPQKLLASVARVRALRSQLISEALFATAVPALIAESFALQEQVARRAVTWVRRDTALLPLSLDHITTFYVATPSQATHMSAADPQDTQLLSSLLRELFPDKNIIACQSTDVSSPYRPLNHNELLIAALDGTRDKAYIEQLGFLATHEPRMITLCIQSPYDLAALPNIQTAIALYENTPWMMKAALKSIFSADRPTGRLPVTVSATTD